MPVERRSGPWRLSGIHSRNVSGHADDADARASRSRTFRCGPHAPRSGDGAVPKRRGGYGQAFEKRGRSNRGVPARSPGHDVELAGLRLAIARLTAANRCPSHEPVGAEPERQGQHDRANQNSKQRFGVPVHVDGQTDIQARMD